MPCEYENCSVKNPTFNFPGEKKGRFCKQHKEQIMVDVKNKKCDGICEDGSPCDKQPRYALEGQKM